MSNNVPTDMFGKELKVGQLVAKAGVINYVSAIELKVVNKIENGNVFLSNSVTGGKNVMPVKYPERLIILADTLKK